MKAMANKGLVLCIVTAATAAVLFGCQSSQKAIRTLSRNGDLAKVCSDSFPCRSRSDTVYREIEDTSAVQALHRLITQLQSQLDYIQGLPPVIDSATCQKLRAAYYADMVKYQKEIVRLKDSLKLAKAKVIEIRIETLDTALLVTERKIRAAAEAKLAAMTADRDKWKEKAKTRAKGMWIAIGSSALLLLIIGLIIGGNVRTLLTKKKNGNV